MALTVAALVVLSRFLGCVLLAANVRAQTPERPQEPVS